MYCGSCLRDNALAGALVRLGHSVTMLPLYTPLKTDTPDASTSPVFYGGINSYLQYVSGIFRWTPRFLDWILDRPWLLKIAGSLGAQTSPSRLGPFVLSILKGEEGPQIKELRRLTEFMAEHVRPQIISLPNLMFVGLARMLKRELRAPVICELAGEDIFLEAMSEPYRSQAHELIRRCAVDVDRFVATSHEYAGRMAEYLGIRVSDVDVVYPGVSHELIEQPARSIAHPPTIGYLARICPEKGLDRLIDAFKLLRVSPGMSDVRLRAAGYLGSAHEKWFADLRRRIETDNLAFEYVGEVDLTAKAEFLDSVDVLSVPTSYLECKGIYVLEAMSRAVPVVQPAHGSFPELIKKTGGGLLVAPADPRALAESLASLMRDKARRRELGGNGKRAVLAGFTDETMARKMLEVYEKVMGNEKSHDSDGLVVDDISKEYPTPTSPLVVLKGAGLRLRRAETLAIVGPSGSGKSTLLNILGTLDRPTRGRVRLDGQDPFALEGDPLAKFRSERIGFIFQDHHLLPQCSALENVLVARLAIGPVRPEDQSRARELLRRVGLEDRQTHLPAQLSGGERQRVAIARALINRPTLLLCDEPTGNLDTKNSAAIGNLLLEIAAETNAILIAVTHSITLAKMFARQGRMEDGVLTFPRAAGGVS
jgi:ABC-type lipoprotein export system ATPase subunit/glycosyltransferase involved in cell wall biosynthesis